MYSMQSGSIPRWNADLKICMACINAVTSTKNHLDSVWHLLNHTEHEPNTPFKNTPNWTYQVFISFLSNVNPIWTFYPNMSYSPPWSTLRIDSGCTWFSQISGDANGTFWRWTARYMLIQSWVFLFGVRKISYASWWFQPMKNNMIVVKLDHFPKQTLGGENQKTCSTT